MRLIRQGILLLLILGVCCFAPGAALRQPTISIAARRAAYVSGRPIRIRVVLRNTTDREFTIFQSVGGGSGEQYYSVRVTGPDGKAADLTAYGAAVLKHVPVPGSRIMRTVKPGEAAKVEYVTVSRLFDMTAPGTYVVQVSRRSPLDSAVVLKSNTLTIEVENR
jgi:hypothetical protein